MFGGIYFVDSFGQSPENNLSYQIVHLTHNPACGNYEYQKVAEYDQITDLYFKKYGVTAYGHPAQCIPENSYDSYVPPDYLDLLIVVYSIKSTSHVDPLSDSGIYDWSYSNNKSPIVIKVCDCPDFDYGDPDWILSHNLSHFILFYLGYPQNIYVNWVNNIQDTKDSKCKNGDFTSYECETIMTKLEGRNFDYIVMNPYSGVYSVYPPVQKLNNEKSIPQFKKDVLVTDITKIPVDSDGDSIEDKADMCPNNPETFNEYLDTDGCPEESPNTEITTVNVLENKMVTLSGQIPLQLQNSVVTFMWNQISGEPVSLSSSYAKDATFMAPSVDTTEKILDFELTVTAPNGNTSSEVIRVIVKDASSHQGFADTLPQGVLVTTGFSYGDHLSHNIRFDNAGPQTQYFPLPINTVKGIFVNVTTYVQNAILYFTINGVPYSFSVTPNTNYLITFVNPQTVSDVKISIGSRGYSDDQSNLGYIYQDTQQGNSNGGGCLIATATYGSELALQVQQLRELRDNSLLQTKSGTSFMVGFNQFYYSFSPTVADWERENQIFKEFVKISLTPLISSLSILNYVDMDSEVEVLEYGISLILLNIGMYFVAPSVVIIGIRKKF